jgi:hypothetical protein
MTAAIALLDPGGSPERAKGRRRDRRAGLGALLAALVPALRRIERVAATDFMILIQGGIGPQPHSAVGVPV